MYEDAEDEFVTEKVAELVANGFFDVSLDPDSEDFIFRLTPEAQDIDPEAYEIFMQHNLEEVTEQVQELVEQGIVEVSGINEDGEALYSLTPLGRIMKENGSL